MEDNDEEKLFFCCRIKGSTSLFDLRPKKQLGVIAVKNTFQAIGE
jgi:restriction endonuclease